MRGAYKSIRYLVGDVGVHPLVLLHRVAHGDAQPIAGCCRGNTTPGHVHVGQYVRVGDAIGHCSLGRIAMFLRL